MDRRTFLKTLLTVTSVISAGGLMSVKGAYGDEKKEERINRLVNKERPSVLEQKHVPLIESPSEVDSGEWFIVKVKVGYMKEHPSTPEHWITRIKLLVDGQEIAMTRYHVGGIGSPEATFRIRLQRPVTLEAIEHCNIHGTWISEPVTVKVKSK
jgi:superoxide reductase